MKKICSIITGVCINLYTAISFATDKFEILPDLPEPLAKAQAASVSTTNSAINNSVTQSIGHEPNLLSVLLSLIFVILLIYATSIIYTKLNKVNMKTLKKQIGENNSSRVSVVSTTQLGVNKTLHIVELDGKRMLIGASASSIQLLKDLGAYPPQEIETGEFSNIEIPNIRIPKIEIPKIEFPNIGFTKAFVNGMKKRKTDAKNEDSDDFEISEVYEEDSDGIIDKLFQNKEQEPENETAPEPEKTSRVEPDDYALYKKYL